MPTIIPLSMLAVGESAEICTVVGVPDQTRRLGELGLREGVRIQMLRRGSPCIVRLENSRLCFRESDVSNILVRPTRGATEASP